MWMAFSFHEESALPIDTPCTISTSVPVPAPCSSLIALPVTIDWFACPKFTSGIEVSCLIMRSTWFANSPCAISVPEGGVRYVTARPRGRG
jgi:hypothetical protein